MILKHDEIEEIIAAGVQKSSDVSMENIVNAFLKEISEDAEYIVPVFYEDEIKSKDVFSIRIMEDEEGCQYIPLYTSEDEFKKSEESEYRFLLADSLIKHVVEKQDICGIVINPYGFVCKLNKGVLWRVIETKCEKSTDKAFYSRLINKAIRFAVDYHSGQMRKGTTEPFITHPIEVFAIMSSMGLVTNDPRLVIAGILYNVVEDTSASIEMVQWQFGYDVAELISFHSEDKSLSWDERKQILIRNLGSADARVKMLVLSDVLANLRSLSRDLRLHGDIVWEKFNPSKEKKAWYYSKVQDELYELQYYTDTYPRYWEMVDLYKDIFVTFYYDDVNELIIQVGTDGEGYCFRRSDLRNYEWNDPIPGTAKVVNRKYAERIEDNWREEQNEPVIWFEMKDDGTPVLVKESGDKIVSSEHSEMFDQTVQSQQGWQRSRLFMEAKGIWDATAFAATMSATFAFGPERDGRCYTFTSCEEADRRMYHNLTEEQTAYCRRCVDEFYAIPDLQRRWQKVILHPICLILRRDGSLEPISLTKLDPDIIKRFPQQTVQIGNKESYQWIFDNNF